ncbi:methyltransferase domain-containing protein [Pseudomonadota bacterium]
MMLQEHLDYLSDRNRLDLFRKAIDHAVRPGNRVLDLGCGSGVLGLLCLKAGAGSVVAIDHSAMIEVARETFGRAGYAGRTNCIKGNSHRVELPETFDLIIADHVGYFGLDYGIVHTLQDARIRFLKPGGTLLPKMIVPQLAAVEAPGARRRADGWQAESVPAEFHWLQQLSINSKHCFKFPGSAVLSSPARLDAIRLCDQQPEFFSLTTELQIERDGEMHGLAGWFDCELADDIWMTNSPLAEMPIDRPQVFLPIDDIVSVNRGDSIKATIMMRPAEQQLAWVVDFPASGRRFSHSTWQGMLLSGSDLMRTRPERVPRLSREGQARSIVLKYCDGERNAAEIERAVLREHPELFPSSAELSRFVYSVLARDTE